MSTVPDLAKQCLHYLVRHVFNAHELPLPVAYSDLAKHIGRVQWDGKGYGRGMGKILGAMGNALQALEGEWGEPIPHLQSLIVRKSGPMQGLPDTGIDLFWPDYNTLTKAEKRNKILAEYLRIRDFGSRWNDVLRALGMEPVAHTSASKKAGCGGGESPQHLALKAYVLANPQLVGAQESDPKQPEYCFPSADAVDVLFQGPHTWVAVEVKSRISPDLDYLRGIYQVVKYRSLLEAMQLDADYAITPSHKIRAVLVLESALPEQYAALAKALDVPVIEHVVPS